MRVTTQKFISQNPLTLLANNSVSKLPESDFHQICQLIIQQLTVLLPTVAIWTVYHDLERGNRHLVAEYLPECLPTSNFVCGQFNPNFSCLQAENWWRDDFPVLKITELEASDSYHTYVCRISKQNATTAEYILICTSKLLSTEQQQLLLGNAQILSNYLAMYRERSHQQQEIAALSQVLGQAEHQLRNPLALINLYAENLRLALPQGSLQEQAALIRQTVDELSIKLSDLLYRGQKANLNLKRHNLQTIIRECIKSLQHLLKEKELTINYPEQSVYVTVDNWQMKQVFDNLLSNAIHFSPRGGTITCNWQAYSNEVLMEICDRGSGIAPEELKQIFKPYYSRRLGGTGLGLAIAQKIILAHQGNLWAENLPEGGAQFSFTLPHKQQK
ncbi:HAMP domain-containing histidine kinase [Fortiea sp. LEGE XX443]|uniref:sensor histidine kinase n=1 Tax=Fortiea sp. LEGE XX443 TaxID=1828611 RepID=UPI001880C160|nr:HAMP domain-containing sensor histidine kinase [Fortiea sp. LEGE XX443]MBE9007929.1 HAMP domain-containing histidine kinase [Fortiea sp. LEGE XX443]